MRQAISGHLTENGFATKAAQRSRPRRDRSESLLAVGPARENTDRSMGGCSSKSDVLAHEQIDVKVEGGRAANHSEAAVAGGVVKVATLPNKEQAVASDHSDEEVRQPVAASEGTQPGVEAVHVPVEHAALPVEEPGASDVVETADATCAAAGPEDAQSLAASSAAPDEPAAPAAQEPGALDLVETAGAVAAGAVRPGDARSLAASSAAELTALLLECKLSVTAISPFLRQLLDEVRRAVDAAVAKDSSLAPSPEMGAELRLIRFLGANKWDAASASAEYIHALGLRKEHRLDGLRAQILAANPGFFGGGGAELECIFLHQTSRAVNEVHPRTFTDSDTDGAHRPLIDRHGNLVVVECPGAVDYAAIAEVGMPAWKLEHYTFNELRVLALDELSVRSGTLQLTCTVMDMSGISLVPNPFAPKVEKEGKKAAAAVSEVTKVVYPTTTFKTYMVNLSEATVKMAGPAIKAFVPARSAAKLKIFGQDFKAALFEDVDAANLPKRLGGELPNGNQWAWVDKKRKKK